MNGRSLTGERLDEAPDEQLVAIAVETNDTTVFSILVQRHQSRIRNWLRQLTMNSALADDLAQDTFVQAWRRIDSFKGTGTFAGWITKIAYNHFLRARRQREREQEVIGDLRYLVQESTGCLNEAWAELHKFMLLLSLEERVAIVLSYAHGFSHREIADITGMPIGTVKTHIRRGRARISEQLMIGDE